MKKERKGKSKVTGGKKIISRNLSTRLQMANHIHSKAKSLSEGKCKHRLIPTLYQYVLHAAYRQIVLAGLYLYLVGLLLANCL